MASVKELRARLKGVETIQKITKAMKMVAASRLRMVQKSVKQVLLGFKFFSSFFQGVHNLENTKHQLIISITSERGLCGGINGAVNKSTLYYSSDLHHRAVKNDIFIVGSKGRDYLLRNCGQYVLRNVDQMGNKPFSFLTVSLLVEEFIFLSFDQVTIFFNVFENVASQKVYALDVLSYSLASKKVPNAYINESDDSSENINDLIGDLYQFSWTFLFFYVLVQNLTSEQAARVSAMESASKNALEIITNLRIFYNKARQSSITRELIEIISCANAISTNGRRG